MINLPFWNHLKHLKRISLKQTLVSLFCIVLILWLTVHSCTKIIWHENSHRIGLDPTWYPLNLQGKEKNILAFSEDLLMAIADQEKMVLTLVTVSFDNLFAGLDGSYYDAVLSSLKPTLINRDWYYFSDPYFLLGPVLLVRADSSATSITSLANKTVGVRTGTPLIFNVDQYPSILITTYDNVSQALNDLDKGIIEGFILDAISAHTYTTGLYTKRLKIISVPLSDTGLRFITRKEPEGARLIKGFNEGLRALKESGTYDQLLTKWSLEKG